MFIKKRLIYYNINLIIRFQRNCYNYFIFNHYKNSIIYKPGFYLKRMKKKKFWKKKFFFFKILYLRLVKHFYKFIIIWDLKLDKRLIVHNYMMLFKLTLFFLVLDNDFLYLKKSFFSRLKKRKRIKKFIKKKLLKTENLEFICLYMF